MKVRRSHRGSNALFAPVEDPVLYDIPHRLSQLSKDTGPAAEDYGNIEIINKQD